MKIKNSILLFLLSVFLIPIAYGQNITIKGKVTVSDQSGGVPGIAVLVKGTTTGTNTDVEGNYSLQVPSTSQMLVFSLIGYETQEILIGSQTEINVVLKVSVGKLDEIVVVGYGTSTTKELTGAVSTLKGGSLEKLNPTRIENALQGQVAGVQITSSSGSPGGTQNIRIRGYTTNGNNNPLVVVDGVPYGVEGLSALNPNDIESVSVLKDATAGIYGVRAANGVIIVTTKTGKKRQGTKFSFDSYYGVQETTRKMQLLNATQYAVLKNEAAAAGGTTLPFNNTSLGTGTDWQNAVFSTAPVQNYNLSAVGGSEKSTFSIGSSYFQQDGIVGGDKSGFTRYNARLNFKTDLTDKFTFTNTLLYTHEQRKGLPENGIGSVLFNAINNSPTQSIYDTKGNFTYAEGIGDVINPVAQMANTYNNAFTNKVVGSLGLDYQISPALSVTARAGYNYAIVNSLNFSPLAYYGSGKAQNTATNADLAAPLVDLGKGVLVERGASVSETRSIYFNYNLETYLNYEKSFGVHKIKGTLGVTTLADMGDVVSGVGFGVPYNSYAFADLSAVDPNNLLNSSSSYQYESRLSSMFLRGEYQYANKYLFSAIVRRDGSSNFGSNNRFGVFPSASAAWIFSEEDFLKSSFLTFGKLRTSYGISGNDKIGLFRYRGLLNGEAEYPFNDQLVTGVALGAVGNPDLRWEQTAQFNVGVDLTFFNGDLSASIDYFNKTTKDLLFSPDVTGVLGSYGPGGSPPTVNAGSVLNSGLELALSYNKTLSNGLGFNVSYNIATLNNQVLSLAAGQDFIPTGVFGVGGITSSRFQVGQPMGYFFGYKTDGIYQNKEQIGSSATQDGAQVGDIKYKDLNGDGKIDFSGNTDKTIIGSPIPDVTMGLNLGVNYKGFDFSTLIYGSFGNEILRNYERQTPLANMLNYKLARWTGEGSTNEHPRLTTGANRNNVISEYYVEDGSFVRFKNVQLGYTIPARLLEKIKIQRCRVYFAVNNLLTITKYRGFDPDLGSFDPLSSGIDFGFYPQARSYMLGLNVGF
jgi:TonB-dependent starch-binding outer membrane protein SusC